MDQFLAVAKAGTRRRRAGFTGAQLICDTRLSVMLVPGGGVMFQSRIA